MPLPVTALFAAILSVMLCVLLIRVTRNRYRAKVSLYDGGDEKLGRAIRAHGNFIETAPYALLLMAVIEINGADKMLLWGLGVVLVISRLMHAYGIYGGRETLKIRVFGMYGTFAVLLTATAEAFIQAASAFR